MLKLLEFSGCKMFIDDSHPLQKVVGDHGLAYEPHIRREIQRRAPAAKVFWDLGANVGIHTISAKEVNPDLAIVCFECSPHNLVPLCQTVAINKWADVAIIPAAVGDHNGVVGYSGNPDQLLIGFHPGCEYLPCITLDSLDLPLPDFVKLDVDGSELNTLRNATKLMSARPVIIAEYCLELLEYHGQVDDYINFFLDNNYYVEIMNSKENSIESPQEAAQKISKFPGRVCDLLCIPF